MKIEKKVLRKKTKEREMNSYGLGLEMLPKFVLIHLY